MSKILTDDIIPELKYKVKSGSSNLKVYAVEPTEDGVLNIVDSSLPSTPVNGLQFVVRPTANVTNPKISLNGSTPNGGISVQHIGNNPSGNRPNMTNMASYNNYLMVYLGNYWRAINVPAPITAADADVAGIMNSAGDNGQLFGLGGGAIQLADNSNLNDVGNRTGFYRGHNLVNAPDDDYYLIEHLVYTSGYKRQIASKVYGRDSIFCRTYTMEKGWTEWTRIMTASNTLDQTYPVGTIYQTMTLDTPAKVAAALGGGTWVATNMGMTIVGYDSTQSEFNAVLKEGGAKTVTLTTQQIPSHTHVVNYKNVYLGSGGTLVSEVGGDYTINTGATGGGQAHNNLQPYKVHYVYRRTA